MPNGVMLTVLSFCFHKVYIVIKCIQVALAQDIIVCIAYA